MPNREQVFIAAGAIAYALAVDYVGGPSNLKLVMASLLLLGACSYKFLPALSGADFAWGRVFGVMFAYVAWLVLSIYTSTLAENSIHFAWLLASFVFVVLLTADLERRQWLVAVAMFAITGVLSACWGIAEFIVTSRRASGPIIDPSTWDALMNLFFFTALTVYLTDTHRRYRYAALAGLAIFSVASFSAYSRVGTVVFFAALAFALLAGSRFRALRARLAIVVGIVVVSFALVNFHASLEEAAAHDEGYTLDMEQKGWSQRFAMWRAGWSIYKEYPVFGSGPGTFKLHYPRYRTHDDLLNFGNFVHNDYLQFLLEGGPVLLSFLLAFVGLLLTGLVSRGLRLARGEERELEPVLLSIAMGTLLIHALMNFVLYQLQTQMLMGLLFGRYLHVCGFLSRRKIEVTSPRLAQAAVVLALAIFAAVPVLDAISSDLVYDQDTIPLVRDLGDDSQDYLQAMSLLSTIRSRNSANRFAMATIYRTSFDHQSDPASSRSLAIATAFEYQAGLELNPYHDRARQYFAEFLEQNPWLQEIPEIHVTPEQLYLKGIELYPVYIDRYLLYADYLERQGRRDEAYRLLVDKALPWANLRHGEYYTARHQLLTRVLRSAKARHDTGVLETILSLV